MDLNKEDAQTVSNEESKTKDNSTLPENKLNVETSFVTDAERKVVTSGGE